MILLAVLGIGLHRLKLANALKSALSVVTASVNIVVFGLFGPIHWVVVAVAAPASLLGGFLGARIASRIPDDPAAHLHRHVRRRRGDLPVLPRLSRWSTSSRWASPRSS